MRKFDGYYIDDLISIRELAREDKEWKFCDELRDYLDSKFIFIFDTKDGGQEVHFLYESYFDKKPEQLTNRQYVEHVIQRDIRANKNFDAWLYSTKNSVRP